jgi:hypothetical protein
MEMATRKSQFKARSASAERIHVPAKDEEISGELRVSKEPLTPVGNPPPAVTVREESTRVMRRGDEPGGKSRILKLASIAQYRAKRRITTGQKRLAKELLTAVECSEFGI